MTAIDEIKNNIDIVDIVSETVKLRRTGKNFIGFCPFHSNTHTPAFVVFPDSGTWRCFGQCAEGGDIFSYIMKRDNLDFQQALQYLAKRAGIQLESTVPEDKTKKESQKHLTQLMEDAVSFFQNNLLHHPAGKPAIDYLKNRGLTAETIESFQLGYALESWDSMIQNMLSKGYNRDDLIQVGLVSEQHDEKGDVIQGGRIYDRFRNRIMIPINDSQGNPIGFGARILNPNDSPKFLNSPQTVLFDKGKTLFGLDRAKRSIREKNQAVIVEGYLDVILLHQAGFTNTISPMGTALGEFQIKQIARQSRQIILALDADAAGDQATLKGIELMRTSLKGTEEDILAESKDLIRHENKLNTDIRITRLPAGMDPDEIVLRNPDEWDQILNDAKPIVIYMMESLGEGKNLNDGKVKSDIADQILPLIFEVPDAIERETYRQQLARFLKIDESLLRYSRASYAKNKTEKTKAVFPDKPKLGTKSELIFDPKAGFYNKEITIMQYLYHFYDSPGSFAKIDRIFREYHLKPLQKEDFEQTDLREIVSCYFYGINQDEELSTQKYIREHIPETVKDTFAVIEHPNFHGGVNLAELDKDIARSIAFLRNEKCVFNIIEIQTLCLDSGKPENELSEYQIILDQLKRERSCLEKLLDSLNPKYRQGEYGKKE